MKPYAAVVAVLFLAACGGPLDDGSQQENLGSQSSALTQLTGNYAMGVDTRFKIEIDGSGNGTFTTVPDYPANACADVGEDIYSGLTYLGSTTTARWYSGTRYVYNCSSGVSSHTVWIELSCSSSTSCTYVEHIDGVNSYGWTRL